MTAGSPRGIDIRRAARTLAHTVRVPSGQLCPPARATDQRPWTQPAPRFERLLRTTYVPGLDKPRTAERLEFLRQRPDLFAERRELRSNLGIPGLGCQVLEAFVRLA